MLAEFVKKGGGKCLPIHWKRRHVEQGMSQGLLRCSWNTKYKIRQVLYALHTQEINKPGSVAIEDAHFWHTNFFLGLFHTWITFSTRGHTVRLENSLHLVEYNPQNTENSGLEACSNHTSGAVCIACGVHSLSADETEHLIFAPCGAMKALSNI